MGNLQRADKRHPCPICGAISYCSYNAEIAICTRIEEGSLKACKGQVPQWIHLLGDREVNYTPRGQNQGCLLADVSERDKVYRAFLNLLVLQREHRDNLLNRGLSPETIIDHLYRSVPMTGRWRITQALVKQGFKLAGIPGFYQRDGINGKPYWTFIGKEGIFIPALNEHGQIIGLRIRYDHPDVDKKGNVKNKYKWFSSAELPLGTSSGAPLHVETGFKPEILWITEGEFKAAMIRQVTGYSTLSLPGVELWPQAAQLVKRLGYKKVIVALDMDKFTEKHERVIYAEQQLVKSLRTDKISVAIAEWDLSLAKGIDDLFLIGEKPRFVVAA